MAQKFDIPFKEQVRKVALEVARRRLKGVFVLSTGRVGTASLTRLLSLSPNVFAQHEPNPRFMLESKLAYQEKIRAKNIGRDYLNSRLFLEAHRSTLKSALLKNRVYAETSNRLTYGAPVLVNYFPKSKFIHLYRDPTEVIRSAMRRGYYVDHSLDRYRITPRECDPFYDDWETFSQFEKCCWYWAAVNEFSLEILELIPSDRRFSLPSESLFKQNIHTLDELFEWIGVSLPSPEKLESLLSTKVNRQNSGEFPSWENWTAHQQNRLRNICGKTARKLGYLQYA